MCTVGLSFIVAVVWVIESIEAADSYRLDNPNICNSAGVMTKWMENDDVIIIYGKRDGGSSFRECEMKFGPSTDATKLSTMVQFQTYFNNECRVYLILEQSPYQFFDKDVSTVLNLTCLNKPGAKKFYTDAGSNLRIKLYKQYSHLRNYNFIFNITLTDHVIETEVSSMVIIVIGIIIAIITPLVGCIVYKALKIKRWSKRHYSSNVDLSPHSHQPLRDLDGHSIPPSVRYSSMPLADQDTNDSLHSQTCIVGTHGANGRCTVCNRNHEDFAHVVDVDPQGVVVSNTPNCRLCHRSHEDFVHFEEISPNTSNQRLIRRNNPTDGVTASNRHLVNPRNVHAPGGRAPSDDEEDIDVSGNDLIPPSYDLCPPSYDEAVDMPTPGSRVNDTALQEQAEVDPLYQNIDDVLLNN